MKKEMIRNGYIQHEARKKHGVGLRDLTAEMVDNFAEDEIRFGKLLSSLVMFVNSMTSEVYMCTKVEEFRKNVRILEEKFYSEFFEYEEWQYDSER